MTWKREIPVSHSASQDILIYGHCFSFPEQLMITNFLTGSFLRGPVLFCGHVNTKLLICFGQRAVLETEPPYIQPFEQHLSRGFGALFERLFENL